MGQKLSYCGELVKRHDPDRFFLSMLATPSCREALWALFAFNHEIAKTREVVSETQLGHIRLQWWRDALAGIYERQEMPEHEVVTPLAAAIRMYDLPREGLESLIYAREFDLEGVAPASLEGLLIYADHSSTPLMNLAVMISGDDPALEPVQPVAINYALAGLLRAASVHARQGRSFLPADWVAEGLERSEIVRRIAQEVVMGVKPRNRFLKAADRLAHIYIKQLRRLKYNVDDPRAQIQPPLKALRLIWWL